MSEQEQREALNNVMAKNSEFADLRRWVLGNRAKLREARGLCSQADFARCADVLQTHISSVERGNVYGIGYSRLKRIVALYKQAMEIQDGTRLLDSTEVRTTGRSHDDS